MSDKSSPTPPADNEANNRTSAKKPRGYGGVALIMLLLLALFLMVANVGGKTPKSIYDLETALFDGRVTKMDIENSNLLVTIKGEKADDKDVKYQVVAGPFLDNEADLAMLKSLIPETLDLTRYNSSNYNGLDRFLSDLQEDRISVSQAFFISHKKNRIEQEGSGDEKQAKREGPLNFLNALIQEGNDQAYVRVTPAGSSGAATLQQVRKELQAREIPIVDRAIAPNSASLQVSEQTSTMYYLYMMGPYLLIFLVFWFFIMRQMRSPGAGGGVLSFGRSRAAVYTKENRTNITFDDVAGADEAKEEVKEIIEFLKHPGKFAKLGGIIPRGVLLVGPPGTGKTLMAKAIAGEAEVPFFSISGSDFVEMFVGVGASRVRDLFKQARESSPCIVFLDEIDAVGRKRGSGMGGGHDEREQTLNAILVEMDGFDSDKGIILIAATNRPDVLDPALLRPGRFDRQIVIDMPDVKGREEILKVHGRKVKLSPHVNVRKVARATPGFSGADLAAIINEAAILAAMKGQDSVQMADLEEARDRVRWGREKRSRAMEEEDRRVTAYHEAGHALVSVNLPDMDPVHKVTIVSRGMALGATMSLPERDDYHMRKKKLLGIIAMCYGGRIAEEMVFGDISAGAQNDIEQATSLAKTMVCELGMSEVVGPINYASKAEAGYLGRENGLAYDISQDTMETIHKEIRSIIQEQYARAKGILEENRETLDAIAESLLKFETISGEEVAAVIRGDSLEEFRAAQERHERSTTPPPANKPVDEPDVGLAGNEGLAHP